MLRHPPGWKGLAQGAFGFLLGFLFGFLFLHGFLRFLLGFFLGVCTLGHELLSSWSNCGGGCLAAANSADDRKQLYDGLLETIIRSVGSTDIGFERNR